MKRNIIIFIEVLVLVLVIGFGAMFAYITVTGRSSIGSNKKKRDTNEKVVALVEELNEESTAAQDATGMEAVFGYLHFSGETERIRELFEAAYGDIYENLLNRI